MLLRSFLSSLLLAVAMPVTAEPADNASTVPESSTEAAGQAAQGLSDHQKAMYERARAELEGKLKVEQVLLKGVGEKGVEIEIAYRIIDVDKYAAHPKTTFIADESSATVVPLIKLAKLFNPLPAVEAEKLPPAKLTIWDKQGVIKPGQPVTVVVAGYGQKHLIPEAGPDYDPQAAAVAFTLKPNPEIVSPDAKLKVHEAKVVADGHMIKVTYSSKGIKQLDAADDQTFIEVPGTGERHPVAKVPRIGALAPKDIEGAAVSYMVMDNAGGRIKPGQKVDVVVSGVRAENVTVTAGQESK